MTDAGERRLRSRARGEPEGGAQGAAKRPRRDAGAAAAGAAAAPPTDVFAVLAQQQASLQEAARRACAEAEAECAALVTAHASSVALLHASTEEERQRADADVAARASAAAAETALALARRVASERAVAAATASAAAVRARSDLYYLRQAARGLPVPADRPVVTFFTCACCSEEVAAPDGVECVARAPDGAAHGVCADCAVAYVASHRGNYARLRALGPKVRCPLTQDGAGGCAGPALDAARLAAVVAASDDARAALTWLETTAAFDEAARAQEGPVLALAAADASPLARLLRVVQLPCPGGCGARLTGPTPAGRCLTGECATCLARKTHFCSCCYGNLQEREDAAMHAHIRSCAFNLRAGSFFPREAERDAQHAVAAAVASMRLLRADPDVLTWHAAAVRAKAQHGTELPAEAVAALHDRGLCPYQPALVDWARHPQVSADDAARVTDALLRERDGRPHAATAADGAPGGAGAALAAAAAAAPAALGAAAERHLRELLAQAFAGEPDWEEAARAAAGDDRAELVRLARVRLAQLRAAARGPGDAPPPQLRLHFCSFELRTRIHLAPPPPTWAAIVEQVKTRLRLPADATIRVTWRDSVLAAVRVIDSLEGLEQATAGGSRTLLVERMPAPPAEPPLDITPGDTVRLVSDARLLKEMCRRLPVHHPVQFVEAMEGMEGQTLPVVAVQTHLVQLRHGGGNYWVPRQAVAARMRPGAPVVVPGSLTFHFVSFETRASVPCMLMPTASPAAWEDGLRQARQRLRLPADAQLRVTCRGPGGGALRNVAGVADLLQQGGAQQQPAPRLVVLERAPPPPPLPPLDVVVGDNVRLVADDHVFRAMCDHLPSTHPVQFVAGMAGMAGGTLEVLNATPSRLQLRHGDGTYWVPLEAVAARMRPGVPDAVVAAPLPGQQQPPAAAGEQ